MAAFLEQFQTLRFDLRGYGQSSLPEQPFSYVRDLLTVMTESGIERAHLVAASFGARVALDFSLEHPDRVLSLILAGPAISGAKWEDPDLIAGWEAMEQAHKNGNLERVIEIEMDLWLGGVRRSLEEVPVEVRDLVFAMQRRIYERPWDDNLVQESERPAIDRLAEITCPVTVVVGEHERPDILRNAQQLVDSVAGARMTVMSDAAHLPPLEQPEAFNRVALDSLGQN